LARKEKDRKRKGGRRSVGRRRGTYMGRVYQGLVGGVEPPPHEL